MDKKELYAYIDENKGIFEELSDKIWECAEISLKEHNPPKHIKIFSKSSVSGLKPVLQGLKPLFPELSEAEGRLSESSANSMPFPVFPKKPGSPSMMNSSPAEAVTAADTTFSEQVPFPPLTQ